MPSTIEQVHRDFSPRGLSVLAVNIQEGAPAVARWARDHAVTVPIALDADGEVTRRYAVIATPTAFLVDGEGRLVGRVVGPRDWASPAAHALISALLALERGR